MIFKRNPFYDLQFIERFDWSASQHCVPILVADWLSVRSIARDCETVVRGPGDGSDGCHPCHHTLNTVGWKYSEKWMAAISM